MRTTIRTALLSLAAILVVTASPAQSPEGAPPPDVPEDWWLHVQKEIAASEYHVTWQDRAGLADVDAAWQAPNRAQGFRTYFTGDAIRVIPRTETEPSWEWELSLAGYGRGGSMWPVGRATLSPEANRIEYRRGDVTEWYVNGTDGLKQGFTLRRPPREAGMRLGADARTTSPPTGIPGNETGDHDDGEPVHLLLALSGTLTPKISTDGQAIDFAAPGGANVVHYAQLRVTDARGTELPAWMEGVADAGMRGIRLVIDDRGAVYPLTVDPLATAAAWWAEGDQLGASFGWSVATAGDVNGDGYSDVIVGAHNYDTGETDANAGKAFVYLGTAHGLRAIADWTAEGDQAGANFGVSVATAGDVNGDGYADVIVGAHNYDTGQTDTNEGKAFVYHGTDQGLTAIADWTAEGDQAGANFGVSVATAGDVNGDGYADVIVGAEYYDNGHTNEGRAYVYHGSASGLSATAAWNAESDQNDAYFSRSVSTAGDVNGDGYGDVIVGAHYYDNPEGNEGGAFVYHGSATGLDNDDGGSGCAAAADWCAESDQGGAEFGTSVGTAGDVNGDGYGDVIVGAHYYDNPEGNEGGAFVYHGSATGLDNDAGGSGCAADADWCAESNQGGADFGWAVGTAGDVNGDGYADVIVGAHWYHDSMDVGRAYVYHGAEAGLSAVADWTAEGDQHQAWFGFAVGTAGDVNGDGYSDVIVGAMSYDSDEVDEGKAFVYHGSASGLSAVAAWTTEVYQYLADARTLGSEELTATAGDVNGDGYADVIFGAPYYDAGQVDEGLVLVYHGSATGLDNDDGGSGCAAAADWCAESDQEGAKFGSSVATAGDVNGDGYSDVIVGAHEFCPGCWPSWYGGAFVYYGSASGLDNDPGLSGCYSGADWCAYGADTQGYEGFGWSVSTAGDVDGDGYADVIVGAPYFEGAGIDPGGAVYLYHGSPTGLDNIPGSGCARGADWCVVNSGTHGDKFGSSVATAGDVNGDGYSDVIVGATHFNWDPENHGAAFVYYGSPDGLDHLDGASGCALDADWCAEGVVNWENFGCSVSTAGDVNGDGYADVIVGAREHDNPENDEGRAFVYHGSPNGLDNTSESSGCSRDADWCAESNQTGAQFGYSVGTAGDVNGDGYSDVIIGAKHFDAYNIDAGRAFVYLGSASGLAATAAWTTEGNEPNAWLGYSVETAGDVNGDGYSDVIVGAKHYDSVEGDAGQALVYHGSGGVGLSLVPQQRREDDSAPIAHLGLTDALYSFRIALLGRTPFGRGNVKLEWEVKELGRPFDGVGTGKSEWFDTGDSIPPTPTQLNESVTVPGGGVYHWRVRLLYDPVTTPFQQSSRWVTVPRNGWQEADLRAAAGGTTSPPVWCIDDDGDGYGSFGECTNLGDCDDADGDKNPGETEVCDGKDNDCDGSIDDGAVCAFGATTWSSTETDDTRDVAWGDWDGDGDLDLAVANYDQPNRVYADDGGTLILVWSSTETDKTEAVAWGDWDNDGDLDLAVANYDGQQNRVYANDGLGTDSSLILVWSSTQFDFSYDVAWGDWDNDGDLDLAVGNDGPTRVYENYGGNLELVWTVSVTATTRSVAWGDWDNDGDLDLALGNDGQENQVYENDDFTLKHDPDNADPDEQFGWESNEADPTHAIAWGDWDNDGDLDLAVGNCLDPVLAPEVNRVYANDGLGESSSLSPAWSSTEAEPTHDVAWGDWDGDGDLDLAVGNGLDQFSDPVVNRVYTNEGADTLTPVWTSTESDETQAVAWGDREGDGDLDLIAGNSGAENRLHESHEASFEVASYSCILGIDPRCVAVASGWDMGGTIAWGDWDGDGDPDIAWASPATQTENAIRVLANDGGRLTDRWEGGSRGVVNSLAWADMDADGDLDLAAGYDQLGGGVSVFTNTGGWLAFKETKTSDYPVTVAWGDCDGDGDLDLAIGQEGGPNQVWANDGTGNLFASAPAWTSFDSDSTRSVAWGDWDGDGDLDLVAGNSGQPDRVYENDGGCLLSPVWASDEKDDTRSVAWGDWDGDGDLDLAAGIAGGRRNIVYENADGSFRVAWRSNETDDTRGVAWGDLEGDGDLDLLVSNMTNTQLYVNQGKRGLSLAASTSGDGPGAAAWGDWDLDGDLDFARAKNFTLGDPFNIDFTALAVYEGTSVGSPLALPNTPVHVSASRPGITDAAAFFSSPEILGWDEEIPAPILVPYTLYDGQSDSAPEIVHEYSATGGGAWTEATEGLGGDGTQNLAASPDGSAHTFSWDAEADDICSDNVVFRVGAKWQAPNHTGAPLRHAELCTTTPSFRVGGRRVTWWPDNDADGFGDASGATEFTCWPQAGHVTNDGDCPGADDDPSTYPGAEQLCDDLANNDCNHPGYPALTGTNEYDDDGDTFTECDGDCNDDAMSINPLALDTCDAPGVDEDCDGVVDGGDANGNGDGDACDLFADALFTPEADVATSAAWGDWDGDGDLDLAVGTLSGDPVRVYENDGGGALTLAWTSTESDETQAVAWGDWDDDGDLDLAVGNNGQENRVYANDGLGGASSLTEAWTSTGQTDGTRSVAWGDWDNDGDLDLAVGNDGQVNRVYANDGLGGSSSLTEAWTSLETDPTHAVAWGDWDNDGDLDLAVGNGLDTTPLPVVNMVYTNDGLGGSGSLTVGWSSDEADPTHAVAWGDWDNDGDLDLAAGNGLDELSAPVDDRIYVNDGLGGLAAGWSTSTALDTRGVAWGDRDGDGDLDLAVALSGERDRVYENTGSGLATSASWFAGASYATDLSRSVAWGDRDGDGDLDLAVAVEDAEVAVRIHESEGSPLGTGAAPWASSESDSTHAVAWGDWDHDGDLDLAVANYGQPCRVYENDGGLLTLAWSSSYTDWTYGLAWGDWDGDNDLDLAVGNYGQRNRVYDNTGGMLTLIWSSAETDWTVAVAWGDRDGDGDLDLAVANEDEANRVYDNNGLGTSSSLTLAWSSTETDTSYGVAWGDWDGDLDLDLAFANWGGPNRVYANDGPGGMNLAWSSLEADYSYALAWGDWNGDGDLDLAVANDDQPNRVYDNDGLGAATSLDVVGWSSTETDDTYGIAWGDWDNDGDLDLAVGNWGQPARVYRNDGGSLSLAWSSAETDATIGLAWGDLDGDADLELAVANWDQPNRVYGNGWVERSTALPETPVYVVASRPGGTGAAYFHSSAEKLDDPVQIPYTLFDAQSDRAWEIVTEYSVNGGGAWLPATEGAGGDGTTDLAASPDGVAHTFSWNVTTDGAKNEDDVVFRIRVRWQAPDHAGGPIQRAEMSATTPPFRVGDPVWYLDSDGDTHGDPAVTAASWDPPPGYVALGDDCDDAVIAIHPGAPQVCGDGLNNDCDHPSWPSLAGTNEHDDDGDTLTECTGDCDDTDAATYPDAPEINDGLDNQCPGDPEYGLVDEITGHLVFQDKTTLTWSAQGGATQYEVMRSGQADFEADCWTRNERPSDSSSQDAEEPVSGAVFHYLVRAYAPHSGSWGRDTAGVERALACN